MRNLGARPDVGRVLLIPAGFIFPWLRAPRAGFWNRILTQLPIDFPAKFCYINISNYYYFIGDYI